MTSVVEPLHVARIGQAELRFFRSPRPEPDMPWHAHDDLVRCLGLSRDIRREFHRVLTNGPFKSDVRTIATTNGVVTIAPHFAAQGLIGAATDIGAAGLDFEREYARVGAAAMNKITAGMSAQDSFNYMIQAARHHLGGDG